MESVFARRVRGPRRLRSTRAVSLVVTAVAVLVGLMTLVSVGVLLNVTASLPRGFYRAVHAPLGRGQLVQLCPPPTPLFREAQARGYFGPGFCAGGGGYLIKRVWAVPGDHVSVQADGVWVNGQHVPNSVPRGADAAGRPLPAYRVANTLLSSVEYLLLSDVHPLSFDGRYFGPVLRSDIVAVVRPMFVW